MTMYCVKGVWIEMHACDCEFCSRLEKYYDVNAIVAAPDEKVAASKALYQAELDVSYGKWEGGKPLIKHLGEDEVMRIRGESELPGMEALG